ncbi:MAG: hypothetical protein JWS11_1714, partial [Cypionkella sp.]|nr:hypothetical protein [Cypionkella sp.]
FADGHLELADYLRAGAVLDLAVGAVMFVDRNSA